MQQKSTAVAVLFVCGEYTVYSSGVVFDNSGDRENRSQIAGYDYLKTTVYIDGAPYQVEMRVRVYDDRAGGGNRLYHFTPEVIKVKRKTDSRSPSGTLHERTIQKTEIGYLLILWYHTPSKASMRRNYIPHKEKTTDWFGKDMHFCGGGTWCPMNCWRLWE